MTNNENEEKDERNHRLIISGSRIPVFFPPESLKNLLATSSAIQQIVEQNEKFFRQFSATIEAQENLLKFSSQFKLPLAFDETSAVSKSIERLLSLETSQISKMFEKVVLSSEVWKEQQLALSKMTEVLQINDKVWQSHLLEISKFAVLSQTSLAQIQWEQIGNALELHTKTQNVLKKSFWNFSDAYANLFDSLENQPAVILSFPPTISKLPAIEFFNGVSVVDSITLSQGTDIEFEKENLTVIDETRKETDDRLAYLLSELNAELIVPLQGARLSLNSTNPDRVRHFATSLRELFTHVLHTLAPDNEVKSWSNSPEHFDKGKLTRRARLLYICHTLNQDEFSDFVEKDIATVLAFLQLFQQGTHQVTARYSDLQLNIMLLRMESAIRFLLEIRRAGK
jgi:hypothetical protein